MLKKQVRDFEDTFSAWDVIKKEFFNKKQLCLFDQFKNDPKYKGQPLLLSCPCPKCTPSF